MTASQASAYKDLVRQEYNNLVDEEETLRSRLPDYTSDNFFPYEYDLPEVPSKKQVDIYSKPLDESAYPVYDYSNFGAPRYDLESAKLRAIEDAEQDRELTLDAMIQNLLDDWIANAITTGDPEAEAILSGILDYVSKDTDPNDEEQVHEVLANLFADALMEEMSPRQEVNPAFQGEEDNSSDTGSVEQTSEKEITGNEAETAAQDSLSEVPESKQTPESESKKDTEQDNSKSDAAPDVNNYNM